MPDKIILNILNQIEGQMLWLLVKLIAAGVFALMIKGFVQRTAAYLQFRMDKNLGVGVKVKVHGTEGEIADYNMRWIFIKTDQGKEIIPIKDFLKERWILI